MFELRWVESGDGHEDSPIVRELQTRYWDEPSDRWSEWEDVPVVPIKSARITPQ